MKAREEEQHQQATCPEASCNPRLRNAGDEEREQEEAVEEEELVMTRAPRRWSGI